MTPLWLQALLFGLFSALSLPLGALLGLLLAPVSPRVTAQWMAFGGGALVFAVVARSFQLNGSSENLRETCEKRRFLRGVSRSFRCLSEEFGGVLSPRGHAAVWREPLPAGRIHLDPSGPRRLRRALQGAHGEQRAAEPSHSKRRSKKEAIERHIKSRWGIYLSIYSMLICTTYSSRVYNDGFYRLCIIDRIDVSERDAFWALHLRIIGAMLGAVMYILLNRWLESRSRAHESTRPLQMEGGSRKHLKGQDHLPLDLLRAVRSLDTP